MEVCFIFLSSQIQKHHERWNKKESTRVRTCYNDTWRSAVDHSATSSFSLVMEERKHSEQKTSGDNVIKYCILVFGNLL